MTSTPEYEIHAAFSPYILRSEQGWDNLISKDISPRVLTSAPDLAAGITPLTITSGKLDITVDTPTDWAATVITPIVIALAAAWFTWSNQKFQVRSSTANFRHSWQVELRAAVVRHIGAAIEINLKSQNDPKFLQTSDAEPLINEMTTSRATIRVMIDKEKPYAKEIVEIMDDIADHLDDTGDTFDKKVTLFTDKAQEILEFAWQDIRRDLTGKTKKSQT